MEKKISIFYKALKVVFLMLILIMVVFPLVYIILASFKSNAEILTSGANILPKKFIINNYIQAWSLANFKLYTWNSLYMAFFVVVGSIITTTVMAYVLGRGNFIGKKALYTIMMSTMFISLGSSALYPQLSIAKIFGINTSLLGVIIIRVFGIHVTNVFISMSYLKTIPTEVDEAAKIDGCGFIRIYWNIIFPLLKPLIATVGLLSFRLSWNDYLLPLVFTLSTPKNAPLIVGVVNLRNTGEAASSWNLMLAGTAISVVPMLIIYLILNRYFISGLTSGAVKG